MFSTKIAIAPLSLVIIRAGVTHQRNRLPTYVDLLKVCQASDVNSTSAMLEHLTLKHPGVAGSGSGGAVGAAV